MKLIDTRDQSTYVDLSPGQPPQFADQLMEQEMMLYGIEIPLKFRADFDDKPFVIWGDPDFARAFKDIYYLYNLNRELFQWR